MKTKIKREQNQQNLTYIIIRYTTYILVRAMPRHKSKGNVNSAIEKALKDGIRDQCNKNDKTKSTLQLKSEPVELEALSPPDLSQFKFQKKPHVKIEFDDNSDSTNKDGNGIWEPSNWYAFLLNLRIMRANGDAPVDTMGCHKAMDQQAAPAVMRYHSLIALMLSSQTKDQVTFAAMERLKERGLTVDNVLSWSDDELGKLIYPVGFWKTKIKYIKKTSQILKEEYGCDIPDSVEKLCKLPGVGPKMAHICMSVAWNKITGIGVDTHVHRISNRIGWVKKPTNTPEETRKSLESWLPFDLWHEVNHLMVGFGQTICKPINPVCIECLCRDICPSSGKGRKTPSKRSPMKLEKDPMDLKQEITDVIIEETPEKYTKKSKVNEQKKNEEDDKKTSDKVKSSKVTKRKIPTLKLESSCNNEIEALKANSNQEGPETTSDNDPSTKSVKSDAKSPLNRRSPRNKTDNPIHETGITKKRSKK